MFILTWLLNWEGCFGLSSEESCDLDSSGSTLSVDEESPVETQSEALPVSLKRLKNVVDSKRESNDNAKGKS